MAFEDILFGNVPSLLQGVPQAVQTGFDIAQKRAAVEYQQQQIELDKQKIKSEFASKAAEIAGKIKDFKTPAEKKFYLKFMQSYAKQAGFDVDESLNELFMSSPDPGQSIADFKSALDEKYPGPENEDYRNLQLLQEMSNRGLDPVKFSPYFNAKAEILKSQVKIEEEKRAERKKSEEEIAKNLSTGEASEGFRTAMKALPLEKQLAASNDLVAARKKAADLRKRAMDAKESFVGQDELQETLAGINSYSQMIENPSRVGEARQLLDGLEQSFDAHQIGGISEEKRKKEEQAQVESQVKLVEAENKILNRFKDDKFYKDSTETILTASKVINVLNSSIAGTTLGLDAVSTLLAKYLDPTTGVKEAEVMRVAKAAKLGDDSTLPARIKQWANSILYGAVLTPEAQDIIAKLIKLELDGVVPEIERMSSLVDKDVAGVPGLDAEKIKSRLFGKFESIKQKVDIRTKIDPAMFPGTKKSGKFSQFLNFITGKVEEKKKAQATAASAEDTTIGPSAPSSSQASPGVGSALGKLFYTPKQAAQPSPEAPKQAPKQEQSKPVSPSDYDSMSDQELFKEWSKSQTNK